MTRALCLAGLLALAACGVDGAPERPAAPELGIAVSGRVEIGVTGGG